MMQDFFDRYMEAGLKADNLPGKIGIWRLKTKNGIQVYERSMHDFRQFHLWSKKEQIPLKTGKYRVVLLGDSVARAKYYDPFFSPADYLEDTLNLNLQQREAEVVDLSCHDLRLEGFCSLCTLSISLQPDVLVVFIGGEWWEQAFTLSENEAFWLDEMTARGKSCMALYRHIQKKLARVMEPFVKYLDTVSKTVDIPVFFVIPECNLSDWKSTPWENAIKFAPADDVREWNILKCAAHRQYSEEDFPGLASTCRKMTAINRYSPLPYEYIAQCHLSEGSIAKAKKFYRMACDRKIFSGSRVSTGIPIARKVFKRLASGGSLKIIDLWDVLAQQLQGGITGRQYFMDFTHMTLEGLKIAVEGIAQSLMPSISGNRYFTDGFKSPGINLDELKEYAGKAHFFAAVGCMHEDNQCGENMRYHCMKAVEYNSDIKDLMQMYIEMVNTKVPAFFHKNYIPVAKGKLFPPFPDEEMLFGSKSMEIPLVTAILNALGTLGIDAKAGIDKLRLEGFGPARERVNLLEPYYKQYGVTRDTGIYKSETHEKSCYYLIAESSRGLALKMTMRLPVVREGGAEVSILVNDTCIARVQCGSKWLDISMDMPGDILKEDSVNMLSINWPLETAAVEGPRCGTGWEAYISSSTPVYGHLMRLDAFYCKK